MAASDSMLRRKKKWVWWFYIFPALPPPVPKNVKTDYAITTYKMLDELWLYTDNTSMLKRSMLK